MSKDYEPIMNTTETQVKVYLSIDDAKHFIRRIRKVSFFLQISMPVLTEFADNGEPTRAYDIPESLDVSARQIQKVLSYKKRFVDRKIENDPEFYGRIEIVRLGDSIFVG